MPILPAHHIGLLLEHDGKRLVLWNDYCVEEASRGTASERDTEALEKLVADWTRSGAVRTLGDALRMAQANGYTDLGIRRFSFRSGELYQCSRKLLEEARKSAATRVQILARHGDRHPALNDHDWDEWEETNWYLRAHSLGARLLGHASIEALVNEILWHRYRATFEELESTDPPAGFMKKLRRLSELAGFDLEPGWLKGVQQGLGPRRGIVHHKPGYVDEPREDPNDMSLSLEVNPTEVAKFLASIDGAFAAIFGAFGVGVPTTHAGRESAPSD